MSDDGGRSPGASTTADSVMMSSPIRADPGSLKHILGETTPQRTPPSLSQLNDVPESVPKLEAGAIPAIAPAQTPATFRTYNRESYGSDEDDEGTPVAAASAPAKTSKSIKIKHADPRRSGIEGQVYPQKYASDVEEKAPKRKAKPKDKDQTSNAALFPNKIRHLKKDDGEPLWRKDIQYDFLRLIFEDEQKVFTNSYEPGGEKQTFATIYIDAMARSSKTSKILRDKLLTEHEPAKNMAMVCLLVNLGRMNTTLNFFPEMRAQLRTYHAIPSLQARQDPNSYKQLQDAPRLKSILKGASEDRPEPNTLEKLKTPTVPRTNPVNLIFVLAQYAPKITDLHFDAEHEFHDLIMRTHLSSQSRAAAFLWLMWFYLESDYTEEGADENPFGPGVDYGKGVKNQGVPQLVELDPLQANLENVDTPEELEYGQAKQRERKRIIEADQAAFQAESGPPKRGPKPKVQLPIDDPGSGILHPRFRPGDSPAPLLGGKLRPYESDVDSTRSTPPPRSYNLGGLRVASVLNNGKARNSLKNPIMEGSSPVAAPGPGDSVIRRPRPLTAHQLAVERNRNERVDYYLSRGLRRVHRYAKKGRTLDGCWSRAKLRSTFAYNDVFDNSEDDEAYAKPSGFFRSRGFIGLVQLDIEEDDYGEEFAAYAAAFRRTGRRLDRWEGMKTQHPGAVGTRRVPQNKRVAVNGDVSLKDNDETEDEPSRPPPSKKVKRDEEESAEGDEEDLDDVDKALLGLGNDETEEDGDVEGSEMEL